MDKYFLRLRKEDFLKFEVHEFPNCLDNGRLWYDVWIYYKVLIYVFTQPLHTRGSLYYTCQSKMSENTKETTEALLRERIKKLELSLQVVSQHVQNNEELIRRIIKVLNYRIPAIERIAGIFDILIRSGHIKGDIHL